MDACDIKKLKGVEYVTWFETVNGIRTGYRMGYKITRVNYKRARVWGTPVNSPLWTHNSIELNLSQIEI